MASFVPDQTAAVEAAVPTPPPAIPASEGGAAAEHPKAKGRRSETAGLIKYDGRMVWVSGESTPGDIAKQIAGAALPGARNGFPVYLFSKFEKNTNTAVKGIVKASRRLAEQSGIHVGTIPFFRQNRKELTLKIVTLAAAIPPPPPESLPLSVAAKTDPRVLAGAIAKHVREGTTITLRGIGAKAVFEMFRAIAICRLYLDADDKGVDVLAFPEFVEVQLEERDDKTSALSVVVAPIMKDEA